MNRDVERPTSTQLGNPTQFAAVDVPLPGGDPSPIDTDRPETSAPPTARRGQSWLHWLMCLPMLLIVGYLVLKGATGGGAIVYALGCVAMMGVMMLFMNHGGGAGNSEHRH